MSVTRSKESKNLMYTVNQSHQHQSLFSVEHAESGITATLVCRWKKGLKTPRGSGCVPFAITENVAP